MNKVIVSIFVILIFCVIILGVVNKRPIEDIGLCIIITMLLMGVLWFFKKITN